MVRSTSSISSIFPASDEEWQKAHHLSSKFDSGWTLRRREEVKENDFPRVLPYYVKPKAPRIERSAGVLFRTQEGTRAAIMNTIERDSNSKKKQVSGTT